MTDEIKVEVLSDNEADRREDRAILDPLFGPANRLGKILRESDERGSVLAMAAFAEDALTTLISAYLLPVPAAAELVEGFSAPLGTFASKIKGAFALGLITPQQKRNFDQLRRIRNEFAHNWEGCSLDQPSLSSRCDEVKMTLIGDTLTDYPSRKVRLEIYISNNILELKVLENRIRREGLRLRSIGLHLSLVPDPQGPDYREAL